MLFKDYVAGLNQLLKENPQLANATAVYASDDEGNSFHEVHTRRLLGRGQRVSRTTYKS